MGNWGKGIKSSLRFLFRGPLFSSSTDCLGYHHLKAVDGEDQTALNEWSSALKWGKRLSSKANASSSVAYRFIRSGVSKAKRSKKTKLIFTQSCDDPRQSPIALAATIFFYFNYYSCPSTDARTQTKSTWERVGWQASRIIPLVTLRQRIEIQILSTVVRASMETSGSKERSSRKASG